MRSFPYLVLWLDIISFLCCPSKTGRVLNLLQWSVLPYKNGRSCLSTNNFRTPPKNQCRTLPLYPALPSGTSLSRKLFLHQLDERLSRLVTFNNLPILFRSFAVRVIFKQFLDFRYNALWCAAESPNDHRMLTFSASRSDQEQLDSVSARERLVCSSQSATTKIELVHKTAFVVHASNTLR